MIPKGLKAARESKNLTLKELSEKTKIPPSTIGSYETGRLKITPDRIAVLSETLGVPPEELIPTPVLLSSREERSLARVLVNQAIAESPAVAVESLRKIVALLEPGEVTKLMDRATAKRWFVVASLLAVRAAQLQREGAIPQEENEEENGPVSK